MRWAAVFAVAFGVAAISASPQRAEQAPQPRRPVFKSSVELLTVEASIRDKDGKPVPDLQPSDFKVQVGGKPRQVLFARFTHVNENRSASEHAPVAGHLSNSDTAEGRIIIIAIDRESIATGSEKPLIETALKLIDSFTPADSVGLFAIPNYAIELSRDHREVRAALAKMTGARPETLGCCRISWNEAVAIQRGDSTTLSEVNQRECDTLPCMPGPADQAREMVASGRSHTMTVLSSLTALADKLVTLRGTKQIVFLSGGSAFDPYFLREYENMAKRAAVARVMMHTIFVDTPATAAESRRVVSSGLGGSDMSEGLANLATATGGAFYEGIGRAEGVFDRIRTDLENYYTLGLETLPSDSDGKARDVKIEVSRPGTTVRSRRQVVSPPPAKALASAERAVDLLRQPTDVAELPLAIASYTLRGNEEKTLKVVISTELGSAASHGPVDTAFAIVPEGTKKPVPTERQHLEMTGTGPWLAPINKQLPPGRYRLRFAAVDADGHEGLLEVPLAVGMRAAGDLQLSDAIVGVSSGNVVQPRRAIPQGQPVSAVIEIAAADVSKLADVNATLEVIPEGSTAAAAHATMKVHADATSVRWADGAIETAALAPGRYTASIVIKSGAVPVARVSRAFEVVVKSGQ
jgi:VWFA-related protein